MSDTQTVDLVAVTADFARARDAYLAAMRAVPPDALPYLKPGDDYSLGGLTVHVNYVLEHYQTVLKALTEGGYTECRPEDPEGLHERANARAKSSLVSDEVAEELAATLRHHAAVVALLEGAAGDFERKAPVWYPGSAEAYPTSAADVLGWLSGHYDEHVPHIEALASAASMAPGTALEVAGRFNEAFGRGDVDAIMSLMTDDCVFENTYPPPDGERHVGQAAVRKFWESFFGSTVSPVFDTEEIFEAGDRVVGRWRFSWGSGEGAGHVRGVDVIRVRDGKVAEKLSYVKG